MRRLSNQKMVKWFWTRLHAPYLGTVVVLISENEFCSAPSAQSCSHQHCQQDDGNSHPHERASFLFDA